MALPTFNLPGKNIPDQKQMSMMRSYLSQLKDETESELYDIKWDNLSQSLRDKLNNLDTTINQVSNTADYIAGNLAANYIDAQEISTTYLQASVVTADYICGKIISAEGVLTQKLDAAIAKAGYVETDYLSSNDLWVNNEAFLNKVNGRIASFEYINADYLSSNTLWADKAFLQKVDGRIGSFGYITAGYVTAGVVTSLFENANSGRFGAINCGEYYWSNSNRTQLLKLGFHSITQNGTTFYLLGTTTRPL